MRRDSTIWWNCGGGQAREFQVIEGDALTVLRTMPDESVNMCCTSPPYFGLRDYGVPGQLGLERTYPEYIAAMVAVFREVRRVLRGDGTLWLNLGDSYSSGDGRKTNHPQTNITSACGIPVRMPRGVTPSDARANLSRQFSGMPKPKDLIGIPWRVAFALQADGWWLRSDIIWAKPNPMPESVTDRPTKAHEYLFLLAKSERYYYDADAVREPLLTELNIRNKSSEIQGSSAYLSPLGKGVREWNNPLGRNRRSVWTVATQPNSWEETSRRVRVRVDGPVDGSERIASPDCPLHGDLSGLVSIPSCGERVVFGQIRSEHTSSRPERGQQGDFAPTEMSLSLDFSPDSSGLTFQPYSDVATDHSTQTSRTDPAPVTSQTYMPCVQSADGIGHTQDLRASFGLAAHRRGNSSVVDSAGNGQSRVSGQTENRNIGKCTCSYYITKTEKSSHFATFPPALVEPCILAGCPEGGTVLDPFAGSGTTGMVALRHNRRFVGIELNPRYAAMARRRIFNDAPLWNVEAS